MEKFKGDDFENKMVASGQPILDATSSALTDFFNGAYDAAPLGDLLHQGNRSPLANAISLDVFRSSFNTIYQQFVLAGSFESYITIFKKIFGNDVVITFTVPAAGKLNIDIEAEDLIEDEFVARHLIGDSYTTDRVIWWDPTPASDGILFQSVKGFKTQYELEQMLHELIPAGIFSTITLTFGV